MKKICLLLAFCLLLLTAGCKPVSVPQKTDSLKVVTTLFPQYDFAKTIAGDAASVTLLLPPGSESHSYEPTPTDMIAINESDLFIYTGETMEGWVTPLLESLSGTPEILNLSAGLPLTEHEADKHHHDIDPHVFTNPRFAIMMAQQIEDALCRLDESHAEEFRIRGEALRQKLTELDDAFRTLAASATHKKLIFGGRFAFLHFTEEYGFSWDAAYDSCSSETEPAAAAVARIMDTVLAEDIPVVYYEELTDPKVTRLICAETGAKPLLLHSCHNVSKEELETGVTYLSLMEQNLANIKEGVLS